MPELPDVEVFRRIVEKTALKKKITDLQVLNSKILETSTPNDFKKAFLNKSFSSVIRHGKHLFLGTESIFLHMHFGMTGYVKYCKSDNPFQAYDRAALLFDNHYKLVFVNKRLLGKIGMCRDVREYLNEHNIGVDALSLGKNTFNQIIEKKRVNIKQTLMDQKVIAGIGNIYSDEILYQAKINPFLVASELTDAQKGKLFNEMKKVLNAAIKADAKLENLPATYILKNRKKGAVCKRCGTNINSEKVSGRTAYYCSKCQDVN
ncbi:DNA-formamidopyrimidine glycosylase family protein [Chitinispirillales bacterium ANBcel5]|uniref:Fpg/Nei family DNA glycosylase n=1 Tax=Cellulosispirillum alkaliphilum TaxID=3039283 RepID=UPI002A55E327|nr:DNA-formamidopyrimidine glycosylase family protein [Chitinispirillales bacterium ANBcel5]